MDFNMFLIFLAGSSPILILAIVFLIIGLRRSRRSKNWLSTKGVIVQKENNMNIQISLGSIFNKDRSIIDKSAPDRKPTFAYTVDGVEYEKTSIIGQEPGIRPGETVNVLYNPKEPEDAVIDTLAQKGTIFAIVGFVLLILSLIAFVVLSVVWIFT